MKRKIITAAFSITSAFPIWVSAADFKTICESNLGPAVRQVDVSLHDPIVDLSKSFIEITHMKQSTEKNQPAASHKSVSVGLVTAEFRHIIELPTGKAIKSEDGSAICGVLNIKAIVRPENYRLYIANEFPQNSCSFNETFNHEVEHVKVYREILNGIKDQISEYVRTIPPFLIAPNVESLRSQFYFHQQNILGLVEQKLIEAQSRQSMIDTEEEYERLSLGCQGETQNIVRKGLKP